MCRISWCFFIHGYPWLPYQGSRSNSDSEQVGQIPWCLPWQTSELETPCLNCRHKLRRANGALSKIRYFVSTKTLITIYHGIFASHVRYAAQIWALCDNVVTHRIQVLQNSAVRIMTFNGPRVSANPLLINLELLNVFYQVKIMNIIYVLLQR